MRTRNLAILALALPLIAFAQSGGWDTQVTPDRNVVLDSISADSLKGHLSFLASDLLEGRGTPSRGLDLAAEYIAAQFRRAGLEPAGDDGYFQTTVFPARGNRPEGKVRNVIGVLRGSDPALKNTYVMVTAHYDHLGMKTSGEGDLIYNGANDDGSGTVSVIELAWAMSRMKTRPKRSVVFMTFWGEELGMKGSRYYGEHPVFPIDKTVADVNLEQVGRTDDTEGPRVGAFTMTGFDYSDVGTVFQQAGKVVGVEVQKHPQFSDTFFSRSDNRALADLGVPAHTVSTAFIYPDYHAVSDHWDKVDYVNMAKVDRAVALGIIALADSTKEPAWNAANPKAAAYLKARQNRRGGGLR
jgi:Zn-dependent M28 family amino/carboxypeptidase